MFQTILGMARLKDRATEDSQTVVPGWWPKLMGVFLFALLVPVGLAWGVPGGATLRTWQLASTGLFGGWLLLRRLRRLPPLASRRVHMRRWLAALVGSATLSWLAVALYARWSFRLNGFDYSIFDWMLASSSRGNFMWAPLCNCNHFLLHPSYWMLLLWPLHRLCNSSYLLQLQDGDVSPLPELAADLLLDSDDPVTMALMQLHAGFLGIDDSGEEGMEPVFPRLLDESGQE